MGERSPEMRLAFASGFRQDVVAMPQIAPQIAFAQARNADPLNWGKLAVEIGESLSRSLPTARLGFLYATDMLADRLEEVLAVVRRVSGIQDWVGSIGMGVLGDEEVFDTAAIAAIALDVPADSYRVLPNLTDDLTPLAPFGPWIAAKRPAFGVVHADPRCPELADMIGGIAEASDAFLVGGLSSGERATAQIAGKVVEGGVSGVLFAHQVAVVTGITQGCSPIGPMHRVNAADGNVLIGIDGRRCTRRVQGRHRRDAGSRPAPGRRPHPCGPAGARLGLGRLSGAQPHRHRSGRGAGRGGRFGRAGRPHHVRAPRPGGRHAGHGRDARRAAPTRTRAPRPASISHAWRVDPTCSGRARKSAA